jgi:hypothetical protein
MTHDPNNNPPSEPGPVPPRSKQSGYPAVDRVERKINSGIIATAILGVLIVMVLVWATSPGTQTADSPSAQTTTTGAGGSTPFPKK